MQSEAFPQTEQKRIDSKRALKAHLMSAQRAMTRRIIELSNEIMELERLQYRRKLKTQKWL